MASLATPDSMQFVSETISHSTAPAQDKLMSIKALPNYHEYVQIIVGQNGKEETFHVYQHTLCAASLFFEKALSGHWKESQDRLVKLPEDHPTIFKIYVHFLYTGHLSVTPDPLPEEYKGHEERHTLVRLYVMAEKFQDVKTKNAALEGVILSIRKRCFDGHHHYPGPFTCRLVYQGTPVGSPMRKLMVDLFTRSATKGWITSHTRSSWPEDFIYELLTNVLNERPRQTKSPLGFEASDYFESLKGANT